MKADQGIRLLIIHDSMSDAERFTSTLRNAGLPVRSKRVDDTEDMAVELREAEYDLIVCALELLHFDPREALAELARLKKDIPLIAISENKTEQLLLELMNIGVADVVSKQNLGHLVKVVEREFLRVQVTKQCRNYGKSYRETEARCSQLMESSRDAIAYLSEGTHIHANTVYVNMFGFDIVQDLEGIPILDMISPEDHAKFKKFLRKYEKSRDSKAEYEAKGRYSDDTLFDALMEFTPASIDGESCIQLIIRDRTTNTELEAKIAELSNHDPLTGLYNRQHLLDTFTNNDQSHTGKESLMYIMMDNYKEIRQTSGIAGSDIVISEVAELLKSLSKEEDLLARFDDRTFVLCSCTRNRPETEQMAQLICHRISEHNFERSGQLIATQCSIGVSFAGVSSSDALKLIRQAENACEKASSSGGNKAITYQPDKTDQTSSEWRDHLADTIRKAIDEDQLCLLFQPIVSLQGDVNENYCVLLRLQSEKGPLMPKDFLPLAKEKGLDLKIDRWVIRKSIQLLSEQRKRGRNINFFITLCGKSMTDKSLLLWILGCLKEFTLRPDCLVFQVDDSQIRKYLTEAKEFLQGLKKIRARFAIDNFDMDVRAGNLVKTFPADYIKLKGSISVDLATNVENKNVLKAAGKLAKDNKLSLIAKSVEDANCLAVLWGSGVDYIQGFFLQEPAESLSYDFSAEDT